LSRKQIVVEKQSIDMIQKWFSCVTTFRSKVFEVNCVGPVGIRTSYMVDMPKLLLTWSRVRFLRLWVKVIEMLIVSMQSRKLV
jgi:hypothetical protein